MTASTAPVSPKTNKGEQTAMRIQEVAVELVLKNGLDSVTVEQICAGANVSERTFFNYFKTKELALIGDDLPQIDESKAREFLAAPPGDIFTEAMTLIPGPTIPQGFHSLVVKRLEMLRRYPTLFAAHMDKLLATKSEHTELIYLRLRRTYSEQYSEPELRDLANRIGEVVASLFRANIEKAITDPMAFAAGRHENVGDSLRKLLDIGLNA